MRGGSSVWLRSSANHFGDFPQFPIKIAKIFSNKTCVYVKSYGWQKRSDDDALPIYPVVCTLCMSHAQGTRVLRESSLAIDTKCNNWMKGS